MPMRAPLPPRALAAAALAALGLAALAPGALGSHAPVAPAPGADVVLVNFQFAPAVVVARPGDVVTWLALENDEELPHTITSDDGALSLVPEPGDGAAFDHATAAGPAHAWTVPPGTAPGVLPYYCRPHAVLGMRGFVVVLP